MNRKVVDVVEDLNDEDDSSGCESHQAYGQTYSSSEACEAPDGDWTSADDCISVLVEDFLARYRDGERPTIEDYARRHPAIAEALRDILPLALSMEHLKLDKQVTPDGSVTLAGRKLEQLGDFHLVREIGRGGMGIVFEAIQQSLDRTVAVKVLPKQTLLDHNALLQFEREAKTAAALHHPHIVPIFGTGQCDGMHFLVMQLIDGVSLKEMIRNDGPMDVERSATIAYQIADAIAYAHRKDVLHRDIKPANILIDSSDNALILDFGLARGYYDDPTESKSLSGSLRYMAPERFSGNADQRSDIYSLGLTLYEMLSGKQAFVQQDISEIMAAVSHHRLRPLSEVMPTIPKDLQTIVAKSIHQDSVQRYSTMLDLQEDLQRFLADEPIRARRSSVLHRGWRWSRRNPKLAFSLGLTIGAMILATVASLTAYGLNRRIQQQTTMALAESEKTVDVALQSLDQTLDALAMPSARDNDFGLLLGEIAPSPQMANLLEGMRPLYDRLAEQSPTRPDVLIRMIDAMIRLSQIQRQLGELSKANQTLEDGLMQLRTRCPEVGLDEHNQNRMAAMLHFEQGRLHLLALDDEAARVAFQRALQFAQHLSGKEARSQMLLAKIHVELGTPSRPQERAQIISQDQLTFFLSNLDRAEAMLKRVPRENDMDSTQHALLQSRIWLARSMLPLGNDLADRHTQRAIDILGAASEKHPADVELRYILSETLGRIELRRVANDAPSVNRAIERLERALSVLTPLRRDFPETTLFKFSEVHLWHKLAHIAARMQDYDGALAKLQQAIELQQELVDRWPNAFQYRCWLAIIYHSLAEVHLETKNYDDATSAYKSASCQLRAVDTKDRDHPFVLRANRILSELDSQISNASIESE